MQTFKSWIYNEDTIEDIYIHNKEESSTIEFKYEIYKNPDKEKIKNVLEKDEIIINMNRRSDYNQTFYPSARGVLDEKQDFYIWPTQSKSHSDMVRFLHIKYFIGFYIENNFTIRFSQLNCSRETAIKTFESNVNFKKMTVLLPMSFNSVALRQNTFDKTDKKLSFESNIK